MKTSIILERWDWPIFKAEPSGFDYIQVTISEPSCKTEVKATIPLKTASEFGERLISLSQALVRLVR